MKRFATYGLSLVALLFVASVAFAQEGGAAAATTPLISFSAAAGVALTVIGAGYGISKLASSALESMARQPEVAGNIQTAMIIAAALIEGFTFYALFILSGFKQLV
ncbi:ATP synthase F0, C subunit [Pirellula staleyi DSM 6068]|uniref:ATP synthase F(0) sector subunit c n=1 Tax=Pirellula staleyi (strain ATCC 27377 / DSM 6068 / ICPB 4128) TaxID=530564 RepID=D2R5W8_PIRSD|nr:ATP synthase F0 subunit C [Pirellula staleyi]ADB19053.1 ATP synthase F0, C subunit [Pirellula staleyi DSM 6068]